MSSNRVCATLGYRDAAVAMEFLVRAFGFEKLAVYEMGPNNIAHAELRGPGGGDGLVMLHTAAPGNAIVDITANVSGGYPPFAIHVDTDEPDALFARAVAAGAKVVRTISDSPRGTRDFIVQDPEGLLWSFGTPLPALARDATGEYKPTHQ